MYYLVVETMGRKRCIFISPVDNFKDGQQFNCLVMLPFEENKVMYERSIQIDCTNGGSKSADIYHD